MNKYSSNLDILKGFAILGVICIHFNNKFPAPSAFIFSLANICATCPQLFFIISSLFLFKGESHYDFSTRQGIFNFYKTKGKRIIPLYFFALALGIVINYDFVSTAEISTHLLLINGFVPEHINSILNVEWYLADLFILFFLFPLLRKLASNLNRSIFWMIVTLVASGTMNQIYFQNKTVDNYNLEAFISSFFILNQLPTILLGAIIHYLPKKISLLQTIFYGIAATALCATYAISRHYGLHILSKAFLFAFVVYLPATFLGLYYSSTKFHGVPFSALQYFGKKSLGIYLFHNFVLLSFAALFTEEIASNFNWIIYLVVLTTISCVVGASAEYTIKALTKLPIFRRNRQ